MGSTTVADAGSAHASTNTGLGTSTAGTGNDSGVISSESGAGSGGGNVAGETGEPGGKKKKAKRRKVNHACLYCRRSHMTCDEGRPCQRCLKREIGHLCHDEQRPKSDRQPQNHQQPQLTPNPTIPVTQPQTPATASDITPSMNIVQANPYASLYAQPSTSVASTTLPYLIRPTQPSFYYGEETFGNEFSVLTDFLETLDESTFFAPPAPTTPATVSPLIFSGYAPATATTIPPPTSGSAVVNAAPTTSTTANVNLNPTASTITSSSGAAAPVPAPTTSVTAVVTPSSESPDAEATDSPMSDSNSTGASGVANKENDPSSSSSSSSKGSDSTKPLVKTESELPLPAPTKTEKFLLTAADQDPGLSRDERLSRVIRSKYEAGLLKPYNYVKGYARLSRWMERNVSQESKQQILQPLSVLRPKFRAVAQTLRDIDLVFIEEAFERLLLDYDRVFSAMGVPACLWRRTGEIYKGNREFSQLVGVDGYLMREGRLCIYELMAEESAVNYWEKYGNVAFDSSQKAVLTSCVLRYKPVLNLGPNPNSSSGGTVNSSGSNVGTGTGVRPGYPTPMRPPSNANSGALATGIKTEPTEDGDDLNREAGLINCCFSFTIRRDKWGIPSMIVGNFIRC